MGASKARYKSYILRLWQEKDHTVWRARLESIGAAADIKYFADTERLLEFLKQPASTEHGAQLVNKSEPEDP